MVERTQTIPRQIADELFECVWPFCEIGTERVKSYVADEWPQLAHENEAILFQTLPSIFLSFSFPDRIKLSDIVFIFHIVNGIISRNFHYYL